MTYPKYILGVLVSLVLGASGCGVTEIAGRSVEDIKREHFTPEAYEQIKDIPLHYGGPHAYAVVNFWSNLASILTGHGWGRKVIINEDKLADVAHSDSAVDAWLTHEFMHHLDDMSRDGEDGVPEGGWVNIEEFWLAYQALQDPANKMQHGLLHYQVEKMQSNFWTDNFGMGEHSERIAYVGGLLVKQRATPALERVYRKVLRKYAQE